MATNTMLSVEQIRNSQLLMKSEEHNKTAQAIAENLREVFQYCDTQTEGEKPLISGTLAEIENILSGRAYVLENLRSETRKWMHDSRLANNGTAVSSALIRTLRSYTKQVLMEITNKTSISGYYADIEMVVETEQIKISRMRFGRTRKVDGEIQKNIFVINVRDEEIDSYYETVSDKNFNSANLDIFVDKMMPVIEMLTTDVRAISLESSYANYKKSINKNRISITEWANSIFNQAMQLGD